MMNPLIILGVIGMILVGVWGGVSYALYDQNGNARIPLFSFIPKFPVSFSGTPVSNSTNTSFDWQKTADSVKPSAVSIIDSLSSITTTVVSVIQTPMQWLLNFIVHIFVPDAVLPDFIGFLVVILIVLVFLFFTYGTIMSIVGKVATIALVIVSLIIAIIVVLSILGVLH